MSTRRSSYPRLARLARLFVSSGVATLADAAVLLTVVRAAGVAPAPAAVLGCLTGGAINFAINRRWVFASAARAWRREAAAYFAIVVGGGALVSAAAIAAACAVGIPLLLAKAIAVPMTMACWTYPMSSRVVFASSAACQAAPYRRRGECAASVQRAPFAPAKLDERAAGAAPTLAHVLQ